MGHPVILSIQQYVGSNSKFVGIQFGRGGRRCWRGTGTGTTSKYSITSETLLCSCGRRTTMFSTYEEEGCEEQGNV